MTRSGLVLISHRVRDDNLRGQNRVSCFILVILIYFYLTQRDYVRPVGRSIHLSRNIKVNVSHKFNLSAVNNVLGTLAKITDVD